MAFIFLICRLDADQGRDFTLPLKARKINIKKPDNAHSGYL